MKGNKKFDNWIVVLSASAIIIVLVFALIVSDSHLTKGTYSDDSNDRIYCSGVVNDKCYVCNTGLFDTVPLAYVPEQFRVETGYTCKNNWSRYYTVTADGDCYDSNRFYPLYDSALEGCEGKPIYKSTFYHCIVVNSCVIKPSYVAGEIHQSSDGRKYVETTSSNDSSTTQTKCDSGCYCSGSNCEYVKVETFGDNESLCAAKVRLLKTAGYSKTGVTEANCSLNGSGNGDSGDSGDSSIPCYCNSCVDGTWQSYALTYEANEADCLGTPGTRCRGTNGVLSWRTPDYTNRCPSSSASPTSNSTENPSTNSPTSSGSSGGGGNNDTVTPTTTPTNTPTNNSNDSNTSNNPQTGTVGIIIAWVVGLSAIVYSIWYFKKSSLVN